MTAPHTHARRPVATRLSSTIVVLAVVLLGASALPQISRPGFSPDEEITAVTIAGISGTGLPMMPSGVLYLRGPAYSYVAWAGGAIAGQNITTYRFVSLLFGVIAVVMIFYVAREMTTPECAACASVLLAAFPLHMGMSAYARFYTAYMASMLVATWLFYRAERIRDGDWLFLASCAFCRLTAEFALFLALLPFCGMLCAESTTDRWRYVGLLAKTIGVFAGVEIVLWSLTFFFGSATPLSPVDARRMLSGDDVLQWPSAPVFEIARPRTLAVILTVLLILTAALRRFLSVPMPVLLIFAFAGFVFQAGLLIAAAAGSIVARPRQRAQIAISAAAIGAGAAAIWIVHTIWAINAQPSMRLAGQLIGTGLVYPWEVFRALFEALPLISIAAAFAIVVAIRSDSRYVEFRIAALVGGLSLAVTSLTPSEIHWRYVYAVSAVPLLAAGVFVDQLRAWLSGFRYVRRSVAHVAAALLVAILAGHTYVAARDLGSLDTRARWDARELRSRIPPGDIIICNDELACHFLLGRVDYWLLTTAYESDRFTTGPAAERRGVYAGAKLIGDAAQLDDVVSCAGRPVSLVMLDLGKFDITTARAWTMELTERRGGRVTEIGEQDVIVRIEKSPANTCRR